MKCKCLRKLVEQHTSVSTIMSPAHAVRCSDIKIRWWESKVYQGQDCTATSHLTSCSFYTTSQILIQAKAFQPSLYYTEASTSHSTSVTNSSMCNFKRKGERANLCITMWVFCCNSVQLQESITIFSFCYASSFIHGYVKAFDHGPN